MSASLLPADLTQLAAGHGKVRLELHVRDQDAVVMHVDVPPAVARALPHIHALHGHVDSCAAAPDVSVDLLIRCCHLLGGSPQMVIVRPGPTVGFWLRVAADGQVTDIDLGLLDAVVLLASRRLPIAVELPETDWDRALRRLVDAEG